MKIRKSILSLLITGGLLISSLSPLRVMADEEVQVIEADQVIEKDMTVQADDTEVLQEHEEAVQEEYRESGQEEYCEDNREAVQGKETDEIPENISEDIIYEAAEFEEIFLEAAGSPDAGLILYDAKTGEFIIEITGMSEQMKTGSFTAFTWSTSNQSNMFHYGMTVEGDRCYVRGNIKNHGYIPGKYHMHLYQRSGSGMSFVTGCDFDIKPSTESIGAVVSDGKADVKVTGVNKAGIVEELQLAVWSEEKGQDDLAWYKAAEQPDGTYAVQIPLIKHRSSGKYFVHCYGSGKNGNKYFMGASEFSVKTPSASDINVSAIEANNGSFTVSMNIDSFFDVKNVRVAIWCDNDQNDLVWYNAKADSGKYTFGAFVKNHKYHTGVYKLHVYVEDVYGNLSFAGATELTVDKGKPVLSIREQSEGSGQYKMTLDGLNTYGEIVNIRYAVWSDADGQDDLRWYQGAGRAGGYEAYIYTADHKSAGIYNVHCYMMSESGKLSFVKAANFEVKAAEAEKAEIKGSKSTGNLDITVEGIKSDAGIRSVLADVWCKSDRSDIETIPLKNVNGIWSGSTNVSKHGYKAAVYEAEISIIDNNGIKTKLSISTDDMMPGTGKINVDIISEIMRKISLTGIEKNICIGSVEVAIWSDKGGQDDLVWYKTKEENGKYSADFDLSNHMTEGTYSVHAYAVMKDGSKQFIGSTNFKTEKLPKDSVEVIENNGSTGKFTLKITLLRKGLTSEKLLVPVWSSPDQSNICWYKAEKQADGTFLARGDINNHKGIFGNYQTHIYEVLDNGTNRYAAGAAFTIVQSNYMKMDKISDALVRITVYGANLYGETPDRVRFGTWSEEGGQDDLVWYEGEKNADGSYSADIFRSNHKHDGAYVTHIYAYSGNALGMIAGAAYNMSFPSDFDSYASAVLRNIIFAVETGGQVYGNARYDCFITAYKNSAGEKAITIGAGGWYATEAKRLLNLIRSEDPETFNKLDTAGIGNDLDNADWTMYGTDKKCETQIEGKQHITIGYDSPKAIAIQKIISSPKGIEIQNRLLEEQMAVYVNEAASLGVTDLKARMFCANVRHLGGYSAMKRVIGYCVSDSISLTMDNIWTLMLKYENQSPDANQVGSPKYHSRHKKVMEYLNKYMG